MDDAMIAKLLQTYGAPTTVKNANAARAFFATNPEIAEKRAMGLRGSGLDDNSDIFGAQLEKFMQEVEAPAGRVEVGQPQLAEQPTPQQRPVAKQAAPATMTNTPAAPGSSRQAGYEPPVTRATARPGGGFGLDDILTAILGISSVTGRDIMNKNTGIMDEMRDGPQPGDKKQKALPRAVGNDGQLLENPYPDGQKRLTYQPKLEEGGANARAAEADKTKTVTSDPALTEEAKKRQLQAEIDAENADAKRLQDQIMERQRAQVETKKLSDAAKRSVGRR